VKKIFFILTTVCLLNICNSADAQSDNSLGNWNTLIVKGKISPRFSLFGEGQTCSSKYNMKYEYFEVKTGFSYAFSKKLIGLFGTGIYDTYQPNEFFQTPAVKKEFRTWLEMSYKQALGRLSFEHRVRIEQRFIPDDYKNRLRWRLASTLPINKAQMVTGCFFFSIYDELWIPQYGDRAFLDKNRFYSGFGFKKNERTTFSIGCMSDTNFKLGLKSYKKYLQLTLNYDFSKLFEKHT